MPTPPRRRRRQDREAAPCRDEPPGASSTFVPDDDANPSDRLPRSSRRTDDAAGILPDDLYDYYTAEPDPRRCPSRVTEAKTWRVTDDWPERVPVTEAEIDVVERWFADLLDELFGPTGR